MFPLVNRPFIRRSRSSAPSVESSGKKQQQNQGGAMALSIGQQVWIRCKVQPGPFSEEPLVTVSSIEGPLTGFVKSDELKAAGDEHFVRGVVRNIANDHVEVWIRGSFFTTNGLANVPTELAMAG
jgi:hypothetical protein